MGMKVWVTLSCFSSGLSLLLCEVQFQTRSNGLQVPHFLELETTQKGGSEEQTEVNQNGELVLSSRAKDNFKRVPEKNESLRSWWRHLSWMAGLL